MKMLDIFELCIKRGYTYKQFANFTRSNWSDIGSTPYLILSKLNRGFRFLF